MVGFNCHESYKDDTFNASLEKAKLDCWNISLSQPYPNDGNLYCDARWDGLGCWNYTLVNTTAYIPCPLFIPGHEQGKFASHFCTESGDWYEQEEENITYSFADYNGCSDPKWEHVIVDLSIIGYTVSIASLTAALCIFQYLRHISCVRISMHKNLFLSYILNGISWICYYCLVAKNIEVMSANSNSNIKLTSQFLLPDINQSVMVKNLDATHLGFSPFQTGLYQPWCIAIHISTQYFVTCNFFWMFCEGLYVYTMVMAVFVSEKRVLLLSRIIGWGVPVLLTLSYALVRGFATEDAHFCWVFDSCSQWIIFGSIIISLIVNTIFLVAIIYVLVTRFRGVHTTDSSQNKKAARAAFILIPLLGLQFLFFPVEPAPDSKLSHLFRVISAITVSFQGFIIACIYCFFNGEVIKLMKSRFGRYEIVQRTSVTLTSLSSFGRRSRSSRSSAFGVDAASGADASTHLTASRTST